MDNPKKVFLCEDIIRENVSNKGAIQLCDELLACPSLTFHPNVEDADVILTIGGDGTMLKTIHRYMKHAENKVFFGIGMGTMNFLLNKFDFNVHITGFLENLISGFQEVEDVTSTTILVSVVGNKIEADELNREETVAINDIIIGNDLMSWINFDVTDDENLLGNFNGSGLCISTATGSTGWNRNNRGHVLPLMSTNWSITGIGTDHRINEVIDGQSIDIKLKSRTPVNVWIDGNGNKFEDAQYLTLRPGPTVMLGFISKREYQLKRRR